MPTATLLFADQVGSTEQLRTIGDIEAKGVRAGLMRALQLAVADHGGRIVDLTGDGLFAAFPGAADALAAGQSMQAAVALGNRARPPSHRTAIRVGVHTGEPLTDPDGSLFGLAVVVARRLCDAADAGEIRTSALTRSLVASHGRFSFSPLGLHDLKGIDEPVDAWLVDVPDALVRLRPEGPALPAGPADGVHRTPRATPPPTRLVAHPEAFVELVDRWHATATRQEPNLVVVCGPADHTGEVMRELQARIAFDGGIDLSPVAAGATATLRDAVANRIEADLSASARELLGPPGDLVAAIGRAAPCALVVDAPTDAGAPTIAPADLLWLADLGQQPGWFVVVTCRDDGRLAGSPLAGLLVDATSFVRVGTVATSATAQTDAETLATVFLDGQTPAPLADGDAPTVLRAAPRAATLRWGDGHSRAVPSTGAVIGRGREAEVRVDDADVSRRHARVLETGGSWLVEDLGSTNGTSVNGVRVQEHRLHSGDEIVVGATTLRFTTT